ncbi:MAG: hypothetical protein GX846_04755, partial [Deltaproteobacteria bacterium]|nr:hypothetical protein [Deltaproteobacteria bacterium]
LLSQYAMDEQRRDTPEQVNAVHQEIYRAYRGLGFEMITVPLFSPDIKANTRARAEVVLDHIMKCPC